MKQNPHKISVRMTNDQFKKLQNVSAKTGYTPSEILRKMIDHADLVTLQQNKVTEKVDVKNRLLLAREMKYQNYLFSNLTKNMNQIAHYLNRYKGNAKVRSLDSAFQTLEKQINDLKEKLKKEAGKIGNN